MYAVCSRVYAGGATLAAMRHHACDKARPAPTAPRGRADRVQPSTKIAADLVNPETGAVVGRAVATVEQLARSGVIERDDAY